jgi:HD superfamily phosphohydrolase
MNHFEPASLIHDPIHGYIPFISSAGLPPGEVSEQQILDHPWVQRLRQIHQLQTAWWVFPSAEHSRFQHVVGSMHLASRAIEKLYPSLRQQCPDVPSRAYVESLLRMAALLHDVGHGPFGHFFDTYYLADFGLTHETLGAEIIRRELASLLRRIRRSPFGQLEPGETLDPEQIAVLIVRPQRREENLPRWLQMLRALFCGIYTVDNMDFVLRDAYMSGYSLRAFDLERILHYSFFSEQGLTIHERGLSALVAFMRVRAELFMAVYYHRTVRAIDLELQEVFAESKPFLIPGDPRQHLEAYRQLTDWSLFTEVGRWSSSSDPVKQQLGRRWDRLLRRQIRWKMNVERTVSFLPGESESASVFADPEILQKKIRQLLPPALRELDFRVDAPRLPHRVDAHAPTAHQNFLYDPARREVQRLEERDLIQLLPISSRICRIYAENTQHQKELADAMDRLLTGAKDEVTNM